MQAIREIPTARILATYDADSIANIAEALDYPTTGPFASALWELLSGNWSIYGTRRAAEIYRQCGYIPFCGYPLSQCGKIETQLRDDRVYWRSEALRLNLF